MAQPIPAAMDQRSGLPYDPPKPAQPTGLEQPNDGQQPILATSSLGPACPAEVRREKRRGRGVYPGHSTPARAAGHRSSSFLLGKQLWRQGLTPLVLPIEKDGGLRREGYGSPERRGEDAEVGVKLREARPGRERR